MQYYDGFGYVHQLGGSMEAANHKMSVIEQFSSFLRQGGKCSSSPRAVYLSVCPPICLSISLCTFDICGVLLCEVL